MNIAYFQLLLQKAIDNSTTTMDWLFLSRALNNLNMGQIRTVSSFANLPSAATNEGLLVWVTADERLYWSTGTDWFSIVTTSKQLAYSWGNNSSGQLGNNTTTGRSSPVSVAGGFSDWCQISAGFSITAAVRTGGSAWAWGSNCYGRLGDNTTTSRSSPVSVVGGFSDWCQISAGGNGHTAAVRTGGSAWAWGLNSAGQLGDNTTTNRSSPVSVVGGFSDWCQISAGYFVGHTAAVRTGGSAWTWGRNINGQLGDNTTTNRSSPVSVVGGFSDWCQISAGLSNTAAVRTSGSAWTWGSNYCGRLGDNTTTSRSSPVSVVGGFTNWCQISAGSSHTAAVRTNSSAWAWGRNPYGALGDNTTTNRSSPVSVVGGFTNWCQISAGLAHTAAVRTSGSAWAWGYNLHGQLGDNTTTPRSSPVSVVGGVSDWCQISAGGNKNTAAIRLSNFT